MRQVRTGQLSQQIWLRIEFITWFLDQTEVRLSVMRQNPGETPVCDIRPTT